MASLEHVTDSLWIDRGSGTTGVLRSGARAVLINACSPGLADRLSDAGVEAVDWVLFTHHRRELADGLPGVLARFGPRIAVPAGEEGLFRDPESYWRTPGSRWHLLEERLTQLYRNYASVSALRWYFPKYFAHLPADPDALETQPTMALPDCVRHLHGTTWALVAENGHAILMDVGSRDGLDAAARALADGTIAAYDMLWLTHFHHDHTEVAAAARRLLDIPVWADASLLEPVGDPMRHFLTCLSPSPVGQVSSPVHPSPGTSLSVCRGDLRAYLNGIPITGRSPCGITHLSFRST